MSTDRPNILLITSDQQHWSTLGCINPELQTPRLDGLAAQGTMFDRAYTVNPTCTPTRASMITGRYPSQHGAYSLGTKMPEDAKNLGQLMGAEGYRTGIIGKCHLQPLNGTDEFRSLEAYPTLQDLEFWSRFYGPFYGFEHIELARNHTDEAHVGQHYALWMQKKGLDNWRDYFRPPTGNNDDLFRHWPIPEQYHYNAWIAERTNAMMQRCVDSDDNFMVWASFFDPHPKYLVPEPWDTMYDPDEITVPSLVEGEHENNPPHFKMTQKQNPDYSRWRVSGKGLHGFHSHLHDEEELAKNIAIYYGMVSMLDKYVGVILDKLEDLGIADDTIVVYSTDHGHLFGQHGMIAKGTFHYEDLIKVPLIVRYPQNVPADRRTDALWSHADLPPTLLSLLDMDVPRWMTGLDQREMWYGNDDDSDAARDHVIVENRHEPDTIHAKTYVDDRYKVTVYYEREYGEIFDLQEDPDEVNNLWNSPDHQDLKSELIMKLLWADMGTEPVWMPRIAGA